MYVDTVPNRNSPPAYLIRESYRENGKVKKRTLANVSFFSPEQIHGLKALLKGHTVSDSKTSFEHAFDILSTIPHGHVAAVLGIMHRLKMPDLVARRDCPHRRNVLALIAGRIISPSSKLALSNHLSEHHSTLAQELQIPDTLTEDDLYRSMRWLQKRQPRIEASLAKRHLQEGSVILYDLSSSYYEGRTCALAARGHNRDGKKGKTQINYGLLTDQDGRPLAIQAYPGNTSDPHTVADQLTRLRQEYGFQKAIIVGDRGMLTTRQLDLAATDPALADYGWISALRSSQINKLITNKEIQPDLFDQRDLAEITSQDHPGERLVACRNPRLARKRHLTRQDLLKATEDLLQKIQQATQRPKNPYQGKDNIARRIEREAGRFKVLKHFQLHITETTFTYTRNEEKIAQEAALDGIYVVRSRNIEAPEMSPEKLVGTYKNLSRVESAFRRLKTTALQIRPIFHNESDMVRAHLFICMLAYHVQWEMETRLAELLFREEDPEAAEAARETIVAAAQRSEATKKKEQRKRSTDGEHRVQSFKSLLKHLGSLARVTCRPKIKGAASFCKHPNPTSLQRRAFELLEVSLPSV